MSDLYLVFNTTLVDLLIALKKSFMNDENIHAAEIHATHKFTLFRKTKELFEIYSPHVNNVILTAINERDSETLYKDNEDNKFIKDIGGRKIFEDLKKNNEQSILWNSLQNLSKHFAIIIATGDSLGVFENIAKSFVEKNKGLDPSKYQSALFSQLFTDKDLSKQLLGAFENPESLSKIINNLSPILSSLAPAQVDAEPDSEPDNNIDSQKEDNETDSDNEENNNKQNIEDSDDEKDRRPSRIFAKIKQRRRGHNKKKKKKKNKKNNNNPFADLANMMSGVELKEDELKELHKGVRSTLSGESTTDSFDISSMMASLASGDTNTLNNILKKAQQADDGDKSEGLLEQISPMLATMSAAMSNIDSVDALKKITDKYYQENMEIETKNNHITDDIIIQSTSPKIKTENKTSTDDIIVEANEPDDETRKYTLIPQTDDREEENITFKIETQNVTSILTNDIIVEANEPDDETSKCTLIPHREEENITSKIETQNKTSTDDMIVEAKLPPLPQTDDEGDCSDDDHKHNDKCCMTSSIILT